MSSSAADLGPPLQPPLLLSGVPWTTHHRQYLHVLLALLGTGVLLAGVLLHQGQDLPIALALLAGLALLTAAGLALARRQRARRWELGLHQQGLSVRTPAGVQHLPFSDVESFRLIETPVSLNGRLKGHSYRLWLRGRDGQRLVLPFVAWTQEPGSPLDDVVSALRAGCDAKDRERLARGEDVRGAGWRWDRRGLWVGRRAAKCVPPSQVGHAVLLGPQLALWRAGELRPFLRVRRDSPNALRLLDLLQPHLPPVDPPPPPPHGRLLVEQRNFVAAAVLFGLFGLGCAGVFVMMVLRGEDASGPALAVALFALFGGVLARVRLRFYERAVSVNDGLRERTVRFEDLASFRVEQETARDHALYVASAVWLHLTPRAGLGAPLKFSLPGYGPIPEAQVLREHLAQSLLPTLQQQLAREGRVAWGKDVFLTREGVHLRARPHPHAWTVLPWSRVRCAWSGAELGLFEEPLHAPSRLLPADTENLHAGLRLFEHLRAEALLRELEPVAGSAG